MSKPLVPPLTSSREGREVAGVAGPNRQGEPL